MSSTTPFRQTWSHMWVNIVFLSLRWARIKCTRLIRTSDALAINSDIRNCNLSHYLDYHLLWYDLCVEGRKQLQVRRRYDGTRLMVGGARRRQQLENDGNVGKCIGDIRWKPILEVTSSMREEEGTRTEKGRLGACRTMRADKSG